MCKRNLSSFLAGSFFLSFFLLISCDYEFIEPEKVVIPTAVTFSEDIIMVFNESCNQSGCHAQGFEILDLSESNAYEDLFRKEMVNLDDPEQSELYQKLIEASGTHKDRSTPAERALILEWIKKGAKNN